MRAHHGTGTPDPSGGLESPPNRQAGKPAPLPPTSAHIRPEEGCDPKQRTLVAQLPVCCIAGWQPAGRRCFQGERIADALAGYPSGSTLTGDWQPDGRLSPSGSSRTALLDVFNSTAANSTWYLHVADLASSETMTLNSWTLSFTGDTGSSVPEPQHFAAFAGASLLGFALVRRFIRR